MDDFAVTKRSIAAKNKGSSDSRWNCLFCRPNVVGYQCWQSSSDSDLLRTRACSDTQPRDQLPATQSPDFPPCFSSTFTLVIVIPRSTALHMS